MKGFVKNRNQEFTINGVNLSGVSSVNAGYSIPHEITSYIGYTGAPGIFQNSPGIGNLSFARPLISSDEKITELIARKEGFSGGLSYNNKSINFESGYISSYECTFSIDSIPQTNVSIVSYGNFGPSVEIEEIEENEQKIFIPLNSGIILECDGRDTNRVSSFSFSINISTQPLYSVGSIYPVDIYLEKPIYQTFSVSLEIEDYETKSIYDYITKGFDKRDLSVTIHDKGGQDKIKYTFKDARLVEENFATDSEDNTSVNIKYIAPTMNQPIIEYI